MGEGGRGPRVFTQALIPFAKKSSWFNLFPKPLVLNVIALGLN